jgi:ATP-dependent Lhr-like helicase
MSFSFHPIVSEWFQSRFLSATEPQRRAWPEIQAGRNVLVSAPTGSGKTLAAFLVCLDRLVRRALEGTLENRIDVVYVSPLKALSNDIQKNLDAPLAEILALAAQRGTPLPAIRTALRTGDTTPRDRQQMLRRPPHILVTTPESLFILLTAERSREALRTVQTIVVDEIHAVVDDKRGAHLALSLARLQDLVERAGGAAPQRIGLSATVCPIEEVARFLSPEREPCIVDSGHRRALDLSVEVPRDELSIVASNEMWAEIYDRLAALITAHRTTLVFVNTRRLAERVSHHLAERLGEDAVLAHHGSLSRRLRLRAEERLKRGELRAVVATASLELGIDIGSVDLVCQIGSPRVIGVALQRIGRSGHHADPASVPKGRIFAMTRDELIECAALVRAIRSGALDRLEIPSWPRDVLAQQIVASAACEPWAEDDLFALVRRACSYRDLPRRDFDSIIEMLSDGIATRRGRNGAFLHRDRVNGIVRGRRGARLAAITSGGAIPDNANYLVIAEPEGATVGTVDEDFAVESLAGDVFLLGTTSWRIRRVEAGRVRVEDARGAAPSVPFWNGEAPGRTAELSGEVCRVREEIARADSVDTAVDFLVRECALDRRGAEQAAEYVRCGVAALGAVPTDRTVVAERFFDESGGMQLVLHAPFGARLNRAWGLALRKRFCRSFNFELQAAATDNGIVISLSDQHSFSLDAVFRFLSLPTVEDVLTQAMLDAPMFTARWRWNASRALAVLRFAGGRKVPPPIQRMRSDDLLAAVFPDQAACAENLAGDIRIPDHPLVNETIRDCLHEAMDLDGLARVIDGISRGDIRTVAIDTPEPSPFSHEILNANPYAYLDDAPLEERRARAVQMRRTLGVEAGEIGALDPEAIAQVGAEAWPVARDPDELHDALLTLIVLPPVPEWTPWFVSLAAARRATMMRAGGAQFWVAAERLPLACVLYPDAVLDDFSVGAGFSRLNTNPDEAAIDTIRGWLDSTGPTTASQLAARLALPLDLIQAALAGLESQGHILRGRFTPRNIQLPIPNSQKDLGVGSCEVGSSEIEWCDRRLLARIHRLTIGRLRREIEPVTAADFARFLFRWQHVGPGTQLHGIDGTLRVLEQLQGYEISAAAWESSVLPGRIANYSPELLDRLCLSGDIVWGRLSPHPASDPASDAVGAGFPGQPALSEVEGSGVEGSRLTTRRVRPTRVAPVSIFLREDAHWLLDAAAMPMQSTRADLKVGPPLSPPAHQVLDLLRRRGASFIRELIDATRAQPGDVEDALWELTAAGLVTADGFENVRALLDPKRRRGQGRDRFRRPRHAAGRWALLSPSMEGGTLSPPERTEAFARQLLLRWGVVFRDLLARETLAPAWRDLLVALRRMEARGEIRGGRFVGGFVGEQFARPDAVDALRAVRRMDSGDRPLRIAAADPLNLAGIVTPGPRVSSLAGQVVEVLAAQAPAAQAV